jgi:3-hydroxyisobutyrate dehydrogenase
MASMPKAVREGNLVFLVSGAVTLVESAKPHLLRMAKEAMHMRPSGAGNVAKLIENLVAASETLVIYEAIRVGAAASYRTVKLF